MSTLSAIRPHQRGLSALAALETFVRVRAALRRMRGRRQARAAVRQLQAWSDAQLRDIGMNRGLLSHLAPGIALPSIRTGDADH